MVSSMKLMKMARKWRNLAIPSRKRLSFTGNTQCAEADVCCTSTVVKGHVFVYSADHQRFTIPLAYLNNELFRELLRMAEEEYGLPSIGPITLPFDSVFTEYAISLIRRNTAEDLENNFLTAISTSQCLSSSSFHQEQINRQMILCS